LYCVCDPDTTIQLDKEIGRALDTLDAERLTSRTAVIVHADHGQSLTEHDYFGGHGRNIIDPTAHIPLRQSESSWISRLIASAIAWRISNP
jgi:membrane-anchored protein YejM (alkaline phosphatase superfamily)